MAAIELRTDLWPLVATRFDGDQTDEEVEAYLAGMDRLYTRREPFATVSWMKRYRMTHSQVQRVGEWMKLRDADTRRYCVCNGIFTESLGFRFLLSSIFLIKPLSIPYQVCASLEEAMTFVRAEARKRGLSLPPDLRPF